MCGLETLRVPSQQFVNIQVLRQMNLEPIQFYWCYSVQKSAYAKPSAKVQCARFRDDVCCPSWGLATPRDVPLHARLTQHYSTDDLEALSK